MGNAYAKSGVDVNKGYETVERIKKHVKRTERLGVIGGLGSFGGAFDLSSLDYKEPVLISGTDGVGTKLLVATEMKNYRSIGIDCVAMCVNDVIAQGAEPLFFLDYIATGSANPEMLEQVVAGVCDGCQLAGAALIGGETAEMPGLYEAEEFDLAGFTVGIVEKKQMIDGSTISEEDVLIGLTSSGIHSNGYSLVRKVFFQDNDFHGDTQLPELDKTLGEELLIPTKIYVKPILALIEKQLIKGVAHITGGGFVENIPRMLPNHLEASITLGTWPELAIFKALEKYGNIPAHEMYEIFNMGIGMVLAVSKENVEQVVKELAVFDEAAYVVGEVILGNEGNVHFKEVKS